MLLYSFQSRQLHFFKPRHTGVMPDRLQTRSNKKRNEWRWSNCLRDMYSSLHLLRRSVSRTEFFFSLQALTFLDFCVISWIPTAVNAINPFLLLRLHLFSSLTVTVFYTKGERKRYDDDSSEGLTKELQKKSQTQLTIFADSHRNYPCGSNIKKNHMRNNKSESSQQRNLALCIWILENYRIWEIREREI